MPAEQKATEMICGLNRVKMTVNLILLIQLSPLFRSIPQVTGPIVPAKTAVALFYDDD